MTKDSIHILNIDILNTSEDDLLARLHDGFLVTPNVDHLVTLQDDEGFYRAYQAADWVICDSKVIYLSSLLTFRPLKQAISGSNFFKSYCHYHRADEDCRIFLLGSLGDVAQMAMERVNAKVGRRIVVGALSPSMGFDRKEEECREIVKVIDESGANVVVVGVGAPKQEKYILRWKDEMPQVRLWMALGATIDFEAGVKRRAPAWVQRVGMEWLYRFVHEPRRLFRRYFVRDLRYFALLARQCIGLYRNPWGG